MFFHSYYKLYIKSSLQNPCRQCITTLAPSSLESISISTGPTSANGTPSLLAALEKNFVLYVIQGPLRDQPDDSEGEDAYDDWREERDVYIRVEWLMCSTMAYDLRVQFGDIRADDIVRDLKTRFAAQVRVARFECLDEFLSTMMEEKTCLDMHLVKMHEIHRCLTLIWNYWMADETAMDVILRSLPPSHKSYVVEFVKKR